MSETPMHPRARHAALAAALALAACGPNVKPSGGDAAGPSAIADAGDADDPGDSVAGDAGPWQPSCPGGIGCPCSIPADCDVPLCLETPAGMRCSTWCGDGACPPGWTCKGAKGGRDATYFCIPEGGLVCRPCRQDVECQAAGYVGALCVAYGDAGGFCGMPCSKDPDCPAGYGCRQAASVGGGAAQGQCVLLPASGGAGFGTCGCSAYAAGQQLTTTCQLSTGSGLTARRCAGSRACGPSGLGPCVAYQGDQAQCVDVQCLDATTGLVLADGTPCDDGSLCNQFEVCKAGMCQGGVQQCACEPGIKECATTGAQNLCQGPQICMANTTGAGPPYVCAANTALAIDCDDSLDDPCRKNACVPLSGACTMTATERTVEVCDLPPTAPGQPGCRREVKAPNLPDGAPAACDDGLLCSVGEACAQGTCGGAAMSACQCVSDADCPDDGDKCNGKPYCDKGDGKAVWSCKINPATVIVCDTSGDSGCVKTACDAQVGACLKVPVAVGTPCSDGQLCTSGDSCNASGACAAGPWTCCKADADCAKQEDGDACNGTLYCHKAQGQCLLNPASVVTCPSVDDTACRANLCAKATGACAMVAVGVGGPCDDGDPCTDGDICGAGACQGGTDTCSCAADADCKAKDDGDLCNGTYYCNKAIGKCKPNPATIVSCPSVDDIACRKNTCQPKTGACKPTDLPAQVTCDADGTGCTHHDVCDGKGSCLPGTPVCQCLGDGDCAPFEDANICNGTLYCDKSVPSPVCRANPKTTVHCPAVDNTACRKNTCQPATGNCLLLPLASGAPCDDGDACTVNTACDGKGGCQGGVGVCLCSKDDDCGADDGDPCNGKTICSKGICAAQGPPVCADGNACTDDLCVPGKGCVGLPNQASCTLGDGCSFGDGCSAGVCSAGVPLLCDDAAACTSDSCKPGSGCTYQPQAPCGDGQCGCGEHSGNCAKDCPPTCPGGAPAALVFVTGPGDGVAGLALPKVAVAMRDAQGATCAGALGAIALSLEPTSTGATLAGATSAAPVAGVASFATLQLAKAGAAWRLRATSAGVKPVVSAPFAVTPGAAAKLVFVQQPVSAVVGVALAPPPQVAVHDAVGNQLSAASGTVTLAVATGPPGAALQGASAKLVQGVATFDGLSLKPAGSYALSAQAGALTGISASFAVLAAGPAAKFSTLTAQPSPGVADGGAGVTLKATVRDGEGNPVPGRIVEFLAAAGAKLTQPSQATDAKGEATGALATTKAGVVEVKLLVDGVALVTTQVAFVPGPPAAGTSGLSASGPGVADGTTAVGLTLTLADAQGNPVTGAAVTLAANPAQGVSFEPAALVTDGAGKASAKLRSTAMGKVAIQALVAAKAIAATEVSFGPGPPAKLAFAVQPPTVTAADGAGFGAKVAVLDAAGHALTADGVQIELALSNGPAGATLEGTTKVASLAGNATFAGLQLRKAGAYTLVASAPGLTPATSDYLNSTPGKATGLAFVQGPANSSVGLLLAPAVTVGLVDAYGNLDAAGTAQVVLSIEGKPAIYPVGMEYSVTAKTGALASFALLRWPAPGTFQLRAAASGLSPALSASFTIVDTTFLEVCNGKDDDANGKTDEGCDADKDGHCNAFQAVSAGAACAKGAGDCHDGDAAIRPGVAEACDGMDNGCAVASAALVTTPGPPVALTTLSKNTDYIKRAITPVADVRLRAVRLLVAAPAGATLTLGLFPYEVYNGSNIDKALTRTTTVVPPTAKGGLEEVWFHWEGAGADPLGTPPYLPQLAAGAKVWLMLVSENGTAVVSGDAAQGARMQVFGAVGAPDAGCDDDGDGACDKAMVVVGGGAVCAKSLPGKGDDCDDKDKAVHPGAAEVCDTVDQDCDGATDEAPICDDHNACTIDTCGAGGCKHVAEAKGKACENGTCDNGVCVDAGASAVAVGSGHSCAILAAGQVRCWGHNDFGQVGVAGLTAVVQPVTVPLPAKAVSVAVGAYHSCAALADGSLWCWGRNKDGELGVGTIQDSVTPLATYAAGAGALEVTAGSRFSCARFTGGKVRCWGLKGALGEGTGAGSTTPVDVAGLGSDVVAISSGQVHSCARTSGGAVRCWGNNNSSGLLGHGGTGQETASVQVSGLTSGVLELGVGDQTACARLATEVRCWGSNSSGQVGDGTTTFAKTPMWVKNLAGIPTSIAVGGLANCASLVGGAIRCWGHNGFGQLGSGTATSPTTPAAPSLLTILPATPTQLAMSYPGGCARFATGHLRCWGSNEYGRLGAGIDPAPLTPVEVAGLSAVAEVQGGGTGCARLSTGALRCWGYNTSGQVGDGTNVPRATPVAVPDLGTDVAALATGSGGATCVIRKSGAISCWGGNTYGQLGNGSSSTSSLVPVAVSGLSNGVTAAATGGNHVCAVRLGAAYCWGYNAQGQVGDGTTSQRKTPVAVKGLGGGVVELSAGSQMTCARTDAGAISCWGGNSYGQLGDGTTTASLVPVAVKGLPSKAKMLASASGATCALVEDGQIACWGVNTSGELGNGSTTASPAPVLVQALGKGNLAIAAHSYGACALDAKGGVHCWGRNDAGQVGDGTTTTRLTPTPVVGLGAGVSDIGAGGSTACAVLAGKARCWGSNAGGALGDGSAVRLTAELVVGIGP